MRTEVLEAIQQMVQALVSGPVLIGTMPPLNGFAVGFGAGAPRSTFFNLQTDEELAIVFNGKGADQAALASAMDTVHFALTTAQALPYAQNWQIYAITTTAAPQLVGREENSNYVYGSSFRVKFYAR